ncbi:MAG TPA: tetratricopeptide repeat protein [Chitinophagaceae bacterium]|nr:tetratricopeptide repeat protein [Chitinophagaceae bacterium]
MKIIILLITSLILLNSCNNKKDTGSPYDEVLGQAPYAGLTDSIRKEPSNDTLYFRRAVLLNTNDLHEPALEDFKKAWSLKKDEKYAFGLANLLLDKQPDSATLFLQESLQQLPKSFLLQLTLARSLSAQNKIEEALNICNEILRAKPDQVDILKMKADLLGKNGNKAEATIHLEKAYRLAPFDVELNYMLALNLAETKNSRVIALCDSLIKADSLDMHAEPYYYKGLYYAMINDKAKALVYFDNSIKTDINFLDGYIEKGSLLYEMKKYQDALAVFTLCRQVSPKFADSYYWIAKCQEATGDKVNAKLNYQRAYSLDNKLIEAKEAAEKIK